MILDLTVDFYTDCGSRKSHPVVLKSEIVNLYNSKLQFPVEKNAFVCFTSTVSKVSHTNDQQFVNAYSTVCI